MKKTIIFVVLLSLFCFSSPDNIDSQLPPKKEPPKTHILFIFDASYSMAGFWENEKKINIARKTLYNIIDSLSPLDNVQMALRVYGHQSPVPPQNCNDTRLEVPFRKGNAGAIKQKLSFVKPRGTTPLTYSLQKGAGDFPKRCDNCRNIIILITDGKEECDADPCVISKKLQKKGIILRPFIIGIGIDKNFEESFECIGDYYNATSEQQFAKVMNVVIDQALNSTTAQVNLLDKKGFPTETDVPMVFFDDYSGKMKEQYVHTINYRGNPDTLILDPLLTYDLKVYTLPSIKVENIKVKAGKHTMIPADAPMGSLIVKTSSGSEFEGLKFSVRQRGKCKTLNFQSLNREERYIVGSYDVEIPTLPVIALEDVKINQSHTTTITIPRTGIANILMQSPGYGGIFVKEDDGIRWVYNLRTNVSRESLSLLPGEYMVVFRPKGVKKAIYSVTRHFTIESGSATTVRMY